MKNKFLKNKIVLVAAMILLGSFSIALAAPGEGASRPPINPGNSSQPVLNLKIGGSNLASAGLDVAGSNALSFFDKVDGFITVFGHLWIGGNTWLGRADLFGIPNNDPLNPGLIPLPVRTLNILGTFLSSTLGHDGTIAAQRPVCVQNSKLILCNTSSVTYQWEISAWGPCSSTGSCSGTISSIGSCTGLSAEGPTGTQPIEGIVSSDGSYDCSSYYNAWGICLGGCNNNSLDNCIGNRPELSDANDMCSGSYEDSQSACESLCRNSVAGEYRICSTYDSSDYDNNGVCSWQNSSPASCSGFVSQSSCQSNSCTWSAAGGTQTRTVICKDSNGTTVADSFCAAPKPVTTQACDSSLVITNPNLCETSYNLGGQWYPLPGTYQEIPSGAYTCFSCAQYPANGVCN